MCHKNILKLIGCCLETEIPILVFESFVKHETLNLGPIIDSRQEFNLELLSWKQRLNISMEIAHVFAYLHLGFPRPVVYDFHCSGKILLDEHCVPKVYDFSKAKCIPERKTHIKRIGLKETIPGVARYTAPEQFIDEKCDVYGFGAFLLELLTGRWILDLMKEYPEGSSETAPKNFWYKIICVDKVLESNSETKVWNKLIENNCSIVEVVYPVIVGGGLSSEAQQQLIVFADLAIKCQSVTPENRPK
ncbi:hypothetical protein LWI29_032434 [Acer saccharum]|uniref:Protein kinase domain-containing protein n=1 Tax=Acer saccharum TaxID=4024 RepID=A0AA39VG81_ACESA|nr:hypothetical protein LWI29_032434 [Acer saccharum]